MAAKRKWNVNRLDVRSPFLNGYLEEVCIQQFQGFEVEDKEDYVYRLKKVLYSLMKAPRAPYARIDAYF